MSYLRYLCLFAYCVVFFFVLCTLCCQFLWIVHFECPFGILYRLSTFKHTISIHFKLYKQCLYTCFVTCSCYQEGIGWEV